MKKNEPAFPQQDTNTVGSMAVTKVAEPGLSKREYFAGHALNAVMAANYDDFRSGASSLAKPHEVAVIVVKYVDALIKELER
jgi:hypothetical protein